MESIRQLLRSTLGRSLEALPEADRLSAAWPVVCGHTMALHGQIINLQGTTLTVLVDDPAWLSQMIAMRSTLLHELARTADVPLTAIHFELRK